jgi:hypothetical protein
MSFRIQIWFELKIIFDLEKCLKIRKVFLYIKQDLGVSFSFLLPGPAQPTSFPHTPAHCVQSSSASHHCSSASPTAASALPDTLTGFAQPGLTPKHSQALEAKPTGPGCVHPIATNRSPPCHLHIYVPLPERRPQAVGP